MGFLASRTSLACPADPHPGHTTFLNVQRADRLGRPMAAARAGVEATLGLLFGALLKIALAFTMMGVFALDRLLRVEAAIYNGFKCV